MDLEALKYPIGKYEPPVEITEEVYDEWVDAIESLPEKLKKIVGSLSYDELELQYRPDGWKIQQVVHHLADSHINSFVRFKFIVTEDNPTIKPYNQPAWATTADADNEEIMASIEILDGVHKRWVMLLRSLNADQKKRTFAHPEHGNQLVLDWMVGMYAWHCEHHLAHIKQAIEYNGNFELAAVAEK